MNTSATENYKGWSVAVTAENTMCANFSFDVTSPTGHSQHVTMGGDNAQRAMERAREMVDLEISMTADE